LQLLSEMGVRFVILEGCWAGGMVNSLDFRFPGGKDTSTTRWRRRSYFGASGTRSRLSQAGLDGVLVASSRQANLFTHPVQLLPGQ